MSSIRTGTQIRSEKVDLIDLFKLGYGECVEIFNILIQAKLNNYEVVAEDLLRRFKRIKELSIDVFGLPQPTIVQADEDDSEKEPIIKRRRVNPDSEFLRNWNIARVLKEKTRYTELMDRLIFTMLLNIVAPQIGMCVERPEHGLIIQTHKGRLGFQRSFELHMVPNVHLFALRLVCLQSKELSKDFLSHLINEGKRKRLDLTKDALVEVKEEFTFDN